MEGNGYPLAAFDDRSANSRRTTGWERYSRSLLAALGGRVEPLHVDAPTMRRRILSDWVGVPSARMRGGVRGMPLHLPTYPPTPLTRGPLIWTVHDLTWWTHRETSSAAGRRYYYPLAALAMRRRDVVYVTPSYQVRTELLQRFAIDPRRVVATPLGVSPLPPNAPFIGGRPYILSVATLEPRKNLTFLLKAYATSAISRTHDLRLVGRRAWSSAALENVIYMADVDDTMLSSLYRGADAIVSPSVYEGFNLPIVEAMSVGVPVICSDIPVHREVAGDHGRFFSLKNMDDLVGLLDGLGPPDEDERGRLGAWASQYTWASCAELTMKAYQAALTC